MKKSGHKLVLRKEIVRALSGNELTRVVGGDADAALIAPQSGDKQCTALAVIPGG